MPTVPRLAASLLVLAFLALPAAAAPATAPATRPAHGRLDLPAEFGVNIHFTKPQPGEMRMLAAAGVSVVRTDFSWGGTERGAGVYDFATYDGLVRELEPHGIRPLFILDYANRLYDDGVAPHTPAGRAAFAKWAAAAAVHFKDKRVIWEIWNEPNHRQFWKPAPNADDSAKLAIETGRAIRAADPAATVIGPATSTIDLPFLETCFKAGCLEVWDAVSVHPYRQTAPETVAAEYRALRMLIAKYAPKDKVVPIYSGEWGYSDVNKNVGEDRQGQYLPRQWLTNIANGVPLSIWYDWRDDGRDPKEHEHHFGTVRNERRKDNPEEPFEPKPAYRAMRTLTGQLAGYAYCNRLAVGEHDQDYVLLFARRDAKGLPTDVKLAAWTTAAEPREFVVDCSPGTFTKVTAHDTPPERLTAGTSGLKLTATQSVQYVAAERGADGAANESLLLAAGWEAARLEETRSPGRGRPCVYTTFTNPLPRPVTAYAASAPGTTYPQDVKPGERSGIVCRVQAYRQPDPVIQRMSLVVDGRSRATQWATIVPQSPLWIDVLDVGGGSAVVRVEARNLHPDIGDWFDGIVRLERAEPRPVPDGELPPALAEAKLELTAERPVGVVRLPMPPEAPPVAIRAAWNSGKYTFTDRRLPPAQYTAIKLPAGDPGGPAFRASADGDRKVKSEQSVRLAAPAAGPVAEGVPVLELSYRFEAGHKFVQVMPTTDGSRTLAGKPRELRMWVFGDGSGNVLRMRFAGADGQTFQPDAGRLTWTGWRPVTFKLDGASGGRWGGKDDGVVRYPIKLDSLILVDSAERQPTGGKVYVSGAVTVE
ncbi:MAG TPA: cellulase family glycosylhydrolase [Humisphaera sp.]